MNACEQKRVEKDGLVYLISFCDKTASLIDSLNKESEIIIPQSISFESEEYFVKIISEGFLCSKCGFYSNQIRSIRFSPDSKIQTIQKNSLSEKVESITIPPTLVDLQDGWCNNTPKLINVKVLPNNPVYANLDDSFIIGKSNKESDEYDLLVFARRDIKVAKIPVFIKSIGAFAFNGCQQLHEVEISSNSKIEVFKENSFSNSSIETIKIPLHLIQIDENVFYDCKKLNTIEILENSELLEIKKNAFNYSTIESLSIPSSLIKLENGWCNKTAKLANIQVDKNNQMYSLYKNEFIIGKTSSNQPNYDVLVFCIRNIKTVIIPSFIKIIGSHAFQMCEKLQRIKFTKNSELQQIKKLAFSQSSIEQITFPSKLKKIGKDAFFGCDKLRCVEIKDYSEIQLIKKGAFECTSIESISTSFNLTKIDECAFYFCKNLQIIEVTESSKLEFIELSAFEGCYNIHIMIPMKLKKYLRESNFYLH